MHSLTCMISPVHIDSTRSNTINDTAKVVTRFSQRLFLKSLAGGLADGRHLRSLVTTASRLWVTQVKHIVLQRGELSTYCIGQERPERIYRPSSIHREMRQEPVSEHG